MNTIKVYAFKEMSLVDGEGLRFVIFLSGCEHHCDGCHNLEAQNSNAGMDYDIYDLIEKIKEVKDMHDGITLSGGDPFFQDIKLYAFLKALRQDPELKHLNIWCYTGYDMETLRDSQPKRKCLRYIDIIVDGKYQKELPPTKFAGSSNQKIWSRVGYSHHFIPRKYNGKR
jgi:anaerobic ribonucleoside-triphosphate reductase activating protein